MSNATGEPMTDAERLAAYDRELSAVMPPDFKDWWCGSRDEWPMLAAIVIEDERQDARIAWAMVARLEAEIDELRHSMEERGTE